MIEARRVSALSGRYELVADGERVATWERSGWRPGGMLELDGRRYVLRADPGGRTCSLVGSGGARIASADRVGRRSWSIEAAGRTYSFRRALPWWQRQELVVDGRPVGSLRRTNPWRRGAVAELPGVPLDVGLFAVAVVLTQWDTDAVV
jgi:hypothetical protein